MFFCLDDLIQYTALHWLREFLNMPQCHHVLLPHSAGLLSAVLPCYAYEDDNRQNILFFCYFFIFFVSHKVFFSKLFSLTILNTHSRDSQRDQYNITTIN